MKLVIQESPTESSETGCPISSQYFCRIITAYEFKIKPHFKLCLLLRSLVAVNSSPKLYKRDLICPRRNKVTYSPNSPELLSGK